MYLKSEEVNSSKGFYGISKCLTADNHIHLHEVKSIVTVHVTVSDLLLRVLLLISPGSNIWLIKNWMPELFANKIVAQC